MSQSLLTLVNCNRLIYWKKFEVKYKTSSTIKVVLFA